MADYKSQQINRGSTAEILQLLEAFSSGHERAKESISGQQEAIKNLLVTAQTPAQIANAQQALNNIKDRSSKYDSTSLNHAALENVMENKNYKFNEYSTALTQADEFLKSDEYKPKASDWMDLDATRASLVNDEGQPKYESNLDMLNNEYVRISKLEEKLSLGLHPQTKEKLFRMPSGIGDGTFDEDDIADKLTRYKTNLDKALTAMMGDDSITEEEAAAISNGMLTPAALTQIRTKKMAEFKSVIGTTTSLKNYLLKAKWGELADDDLAEWQALMPDVDFKGINDKAAAGDTIGAKEILDKELRLVQTRDDKARQGYKNWSGSWYADELPDSQSLIETADLDGDGIITIEEQQAKEEETIFAEQEKEELKKSNEDLMERYGTTDLNVIKKYLSGELKKPVSFYDSGEIDGVSLDELKKDKSTELPQRQGFIDSKIEDVENRIREKKEILDGADKASVAMKKYLLGEFNQSQALTEGAWGDKKQKDGIIGKQSRKKINEFKIKFENSNLTIDEFISQNEEEYFKLTRTLKYGKYWIKMPSTFPSKHYQNLYK